MAPDAGEVLVEGSRATGGLLRRHGWKVLLLFLGVLLPMWVFMELADEIHESETIAFDEPILMFANGMAREGFDRIFLFFSELGYAWGVVPADIGLVVVMLALRRWRHAVFVALSTGGSALLNMATKQLFARERPGLWESIAPEATFSFPSGHAMGSATLAMVLVLLAWPTRARWWVVAAMAVFVPMVGLSRIYLGVHYPSDILAGWAAASIWVVGVYLVLYHPPRGGWRRRRGPGHGDAIALEARASDRR
ncbi:phosphatase PAP2 family protein [Luteimonas deserti]|uniref:undecaprenyl-diphosphate phosphatase n=1 Tax=Luteimonas deserti TaxID=2752306 RepID=A0A7Z0U041_9GAMM|nr:phosphatase PAP2 family protein [Luteimonas deserti]NYZ64072.1 phosphatase PAP2 family protein [Luteimonas deserti]